MCSKVWKLSLKLKLSGRRHRLLSLPRYVCINSPHQFSCSCIGVLGQPSEAAVATTEPAGLEHGLKLNATNCIKWSRRRRWICDAEISSYFAVFRSTEGIQIVLFLHSHCGCKAQLRGKPGIPSGLRVTLSSGKAPMFCNTLNSLKLSLSLRPSSSWSQLWVSNYQLPVCPGMSWFILSRLVTSGFFLWFFVALITLIRWDYFVAPSL